MDDVLIWCPVAAHEEVLRLYVAIDQVLAVYVLDSGNLRRERERERERGRERVALQCPHQVYQDTVVLRLALCVSMYTYPPKLLFNIDKNSYTAGLSIVLVVGVL